MTCFAIVGGVYDVLSLEAANELSVILPTEKATTAARSVMAKGIAFAYPSTIYRGAAASVLPT